MDKPQIQNYIAQFFNTKTKNVIINECEIENKTAKAKITLLDPAHVSGPVILKHYDVVAVEWEGVIEAKKSNPDAYIAAKGDNTQTSLELKN